jgi:hypothetical protein
VRGHAGRTVGWVNSMSCADNNARSAISDQPWMAIASMGAEQTEHLPRRPNSCQCSLVFLSRPCSEDWWADVGVAAAGLGRWLGCC